MTRILRSLFSLVVSATLLIVSADVATAEDPVVFGDPALKSAVEEQLGITDPTPTDMLGLGSLNRQRSGISDLTGLESLNLEELDLENNQISDISKDRNSRQRFFRRRT